MGGGGGWVRKKATTTTKAFADLSVWTPFGGFQGPRWELLEPSWGSPGGLGGGALLEPSGSPSTKKGRVINVGLLLGRSWAILEPP